MIARLKGTLAVKQPDHVIIDVMGVGYLVHISQYTFKNLPNSGEEILFLIYSHIREECFDLFGFHSIEEKELFKQLISVNGIGPKIAINILSNDPMELKQAIVSENIAYLKSIQGIGQKTAERLILELRGKIKDFSVPSLSKTGTTNSKHVYNDVSSALINLGYKQNIIDNILKQLNSEMNETLPIETLIKRSLQLIGN